MGKLCQYKSKSLMSLYFPLNIGQLTIQQDANLSNCMKNVETFDMIWPIKNAGHQHKINKKGKSDPDLPFRFPAPSAYDIMRRQSFRSGRWFLWLRS